MITLNKLRNVIKKLFNDDKVELKKRYHYISGFITLKNNKIIYCLSMDDRMIKDLKDKVLFRTAKDLKDYTGGTNNFFNLNNVLNKNEIIKTLYP